MLSRNKFRIAGAAMIGTAALVGTNVANSEVTLGANSTGVIYAKETLAKAHLVGGNTYYEVSDAGTHNGILAIDYEFTKDVALPQTSQEVDIDVRIKFEFSNMILLGAVPRGNLEVIVPPGSAGDPPAKGRFMDLQARASAEGSLGAVALEYNSEIRLKSDAKHLFAKGERIRLNIDSVGVLPDVDGGVTMTVFLGTLTEPSAKAANDSAVTIGPAFFQSELPVPTTTAMVKYDYMAFAKPGRAGALVTTVGGFEVGVRVASEGPGKTTRSASDSSPVTQLIHVINKKTLQLGGGDFSFAEKVSWQSSEACDNDDAVNIKMADGTIMKVSTVGSALKKSSKRVYLCIEVDGNMEIPAVSEENRYTLMVSYEGVTSPGLAKYPPKDKTFDLGYIHRDGVSVNIAYLTSYEGYNQRIIIVNRGEATEYELEFNPEATVTVTPAMIEGMVPTGTTTLVLQDMVADGMIEIEGGTRTAASLTVHAQEKHIDITTVTVNRESRDTDTVKYH